MANKLITISTSALLLFLLGTIAVAQSGTRSGGGGGGGSISGGGSSFGSRGSSRRFIPPAERERIRQQEIAQANEIARQNAERQQQIFEAQRKQLLVELGLQPNGPLNRKYRRLAFAEAKREFKALRKMQVPVAAAGQFLQLPFRLPPGPLDLAKKEIKWPDELDDPAYAESKLAFEELLKGGEQTAPNQSETILMAMASQLGARVVEGKIRSNDYARAKRFLTGVARELESNPALDM